MPEEQVSTLTPSASISSANRNPKNTALLTEAEAEAIIAPMLQIAGSEENDELAKLVYRLIQLFAYEEDCVKRDADAVTLAEVMYRHTADCSYAGLRFAAQVGCLFGAQPIQAGAEEGETAVKDKPVTPQPALKAHKEVRAENFVLVDAQGKRRAHLEVIGEDAVLSMHDSEGHLRLTLRGGANESTFNVFSDRDEDDEAATVRWRFG